MSDIDEKLREIIVLFVEETKMGNLTNVVDLNDDQVIAQIKQAFADEGYILPFRLSDNGTHMTGQEWYDRFEEELGQLHPAVTVFGDDYYSRGAAIESAKRACGLPND